MSEPFHKPEAVAELLDVTRDSIYKWVREGKLEAHKFEGCLRIADSELERFISEAKVSPSDPMAPPRRNRGAGGTLAAVVDLGELARRGR